jgi:hypothetical protein
MRHNSALPLDAPPAEIGVDTPAPAALTVRQHCFPGWVGRLNSAEIPVHPDVKGMLMEMPHGSHEIILTFSSLKGEKAGGMRLHSVHC